MYIDPITGLEMNEDDFPPVPEKEYMIVSVNPSDAHKALGFGVAHAWAKSLSEAKRLQLQLGIRSSTTIVPI